MIEAVRQWAFTLVITAVFGSVAMSVTISESNKSIKKYVKFACSAVALIVMISPLHGLFQVLPSLTSLTSLTSLKSLNSATNQFNQQGSEFFENSFSENSDVESENMSRINGLIIEKTSELLKDRISAVIYQKTGIKPKNIYIYIKQKDNINSNGAQTDISVEKIEVDMLDILENSGETNRINEINENIIKETELYLKELLNCDIIIY